MNLDLQAGVPVELDAEASRHLGKVLKVRPGDRVSAFNGRGGEYQCEVTAVDRRAVHIRPLLHETGDRESPLRLTLAQGISRGQHMDYTVQKAVELGVSAIAPLFTEFSNVRLEEERAQKRLEHWQKIMIGACEQCGRNRLPQLYDAQDLPDWVSRTSGSLRLLMHPDADRALTDMPVTADDITLLCGPEGGLSDKETDFALAHGYSMVSMGPRILRTETAAIAAIAVCQAVRGDMMYNRRSRD